MSEAPKSQPEAPIRHAGREQASGGFATGSAEPVTAVDAVPPAQRPESGGTTVVRRKASGVFGEGDDRPRSDVFGIGRRPSGIGSGGFGPEMSREISFGVAGGAPGERPPSGMVSGSYAGTGRAAAPPTAEIDAAQQILLVNLGHTFVTREPLAAALTHPSFRNERANVTIDNQRLEFLGDLVLGLAVGDLLLLRLPQANEGEISVLKSQLVRERTLAELATRLGVGAALRLGRGLEAQGGRERPAILADALEAILAAVFVDAGYDQTRAVVERLMAKPIADLLAATQPLAPTHGRPVSSTTALHATTQNYKTALQEWLARAHGEPPVYTLVSERGVAQARLFLVQVETHIAGTARRATGEAGTVKAAENAAAERLYASLASGLPAKSEQKQ